MSGLRLATSQRELLRASPVLLLEMHRHPRNVRPRPDLAVGGVLIGPRPETDLDGRIPAGRAAFLDRRTPASVTLSVS